MNDTAPPEPDVIDAVLGIAPGSPLDRLRRERDKLRHYSQTSYRAALMPADPRNFPLPLRAALAARMARSWKRAELARHYSALARDLDADAATLALADPASPAPQDPRLRAILRHVDLVTRQPAQATRDDIAALKGAGLDDRDVVTLAGLIAFINYQILVVDGLSMLRDF